MKILIVSPVYYPEVGAAPVRITNLAEGLYEKGIEVDVLSCMPNYPRAIVFEGYTGKIYCHEKQNGINVYRYAHYPSNSKKALPRTLSMVSFVFVLCLFALRIGKIRSYDHVIIQTPPLLGSYFATGIFKKIYRKNVILNVSDLWPLSAVELGALRESSRMHGILLRMEKKIYRWADKITGQSDEILGHIRQQGRTHDLFLYRNLQRNEITKTRSGRKNTGPLKIVYAGLLGVAQDILSLVQQIDFETAGAEFHIYGGGNQAEEIETYVRNGKIKNIFLHGSLPKELMIERLAEYDASIVPLTTYIKGAVPSKIFDLLSVGVPVLFCGGGEGAVLVEEQGIGLTSPPADYAALAANIRRFSDCDDAEYRRMVEKALKASKTEFDFNEQLCRLIEFVQDTADYKMADYSMHKA